MKYAFVFPGQGAQFIGMAQDIYKYSKYVVDIFEYANNLLGWDVIKLCFNGSRDKLRDTFFCQPAIFVASVAFLELFKKKKSHIYPSFVAGLSLGELTALYAAEVFSFKEGLNIVQKRASYMHDLCKVFDGTMLGIIDAPIDIVKQICNDNNMEIANINSKRQIIITGLSIFIPKVISELKNLGIKKIIPINISGPYHSKYMQKAGILLENYIYNDGIIFNNAKIPIVQNFTGNIEKNSQNIKTNMIKQIFSTVKWLDCIKVLLDNNVETIIEFGPGKILTNLIRNIDLKVNLININSLQSLDLL